VLTAGGAWRVNPTVRPCAPPYTGRTIGGGLEAPWSTLREFLESDEFRGDADAAGALGDAPPGRIAQIVFRRAAATLRPWSQRARSR
jgi:hypothetical protein